MGGALFFSVEGMAAYLGPQTIAEKSVGADLTVTEFNAVLDVTKRIFTDDQANPNLYLGPTTNPAITGPGGSCPTGYDFYDFDGDSSYDAGECWKGVTIVDGDVGVGQSAPTEALDVVGNVKLTGSFMDSFVTGGISLGASGETALSGFTATSIVGALNEVKGDLTGIATNAANIATNASNITDIYSTLTGNLDTISNMSTQGILQTNASGVVSTSLTLPDGVLATTQSANDNSTKIATTAYVDGALGGISSDQIIQGNTKVQTIDTGTDGSIVFETEGAEAMRIDEAGQVGIGNVADPLEALDVNGNIRLTGGFTDNDFVGTALPFSDASNTDLDAKITSSSLVGILNELQDEIDINLQNVDTNATNIQTLFDTLGAFSTDAITEGDSKIEVVDGGSGYLLFETDAAEVMRIWQMEMWG
ncbi:hypothetical protein HC823_02285 [Candidatus Gracilibacteria bacterium]|nr:hypothetical protein [Candidatus Gracilibacteria bacterium]